MTDLIPLSAVSDARAAAANPTAASPERTDTLDKDAFLKLLVAQLRYQNPLSPSDPNQFMAQTAQFTMVEKLTEMATHEARSRLTGETMVATSTLGREISWLDGDDNQQTGVVTGTSFRATGPVLLVGDQEVTLDQLLSVRPVSASPMPAATAPPATDDATDAAPDTAAGPTTAAMNTAKTAYAKGGNLTPTAAATPASDTGATAPVWRATYGPRAGQIIPPGGFEPEPGETLLRGMTWPGDDFASIFGALIGSGQRIEVAPDLYDAGHSWPPNMVRGPERATSTTTNPHQTTNPTAQTQEA